MRILTDPESLRMRQRSLIQTKPTDSPDRIDGNTRPSRVQAHRKLGSDGFGIRHPIHMSTATLDDYIFAVRMVVWYKSKGHQMSTAVKGSSQKARL